ncbi:TauD/TfdA dioxygenase family protein [Microbulbifer sp. CnH-101-G]|uniref:TauD/TfdA dioxygenase family protein n=1 Tax=Microbulbifer sp. CnH-101-G TaxID=3243393 RepID=UPI0040392FF1
MNFNYLTGNFGIEFSAKEISEFDLDTKQTLKNLWHEHELLVVRDMDLDTQAFVRFCSLFGELQQNYFFFQGHSEGYPQVAKIIKEPGEKKNTGGIWHHDQGYYSNPVKGIALYGIDIPPRGGDTLFTSSTLAYESLSTVMQQLVGSLNVIHTTELMLKKQPLKKSIEGKDGDESGIERALKLMPLESAIHPAVCKNPVTGKPFLYVNRTTTSQFEGMTCDESMGLLNYLFHHIEKPEFNCRVQWRPGTLVIWNNHQVLHYAVNDYNQRRELHRVHFSAEKPIKYYK